MEHITAAGLWSFVLAAAAAIVLLSNAVEKIIRAIRAAKAPNEQQNERIAALEDWRKIVDGKLHRDHERLSGIEEGNRASQRALLALLDHGIDGNNTEQLQRAKEMLQSHLINR